ncbi:MAG TPA: helix-turn-helix transcriptional regulator [Candidatus Dormibacteraeota bacterium]|nr:helix-turn-helix transcriptional regulator [Candidatus Dormibacteraeota bacterium]
MKRISPLRIFRVAAGLTLDDLAGPTGIDNGTLSRLERGLRPLSVEQVQKIIAAIGPDAIESIIAAADLVRPQARKERSS